MVGCEIIRDSSELLKIMHIYIYIYIYIYICVCMLCFMAYEPFFII